MTPYRKIDECHRLLEALERLMNKHPNRRLTSIIDSLTKGELIDDDKLCRRINSEIRK